MSYPYSQSIDEDVEMTNDYDDSDEDTRTESSVPLCCHHCRCCGVPMGVPRHVPSDYESSFIDDDSTYYPSQSSESVWQSSQATVTDAEDQKGDVPNPFS